MKITWKNRGGGGWNPRTTTLHDVLNSSLETFIPTKMTCLQDSCYSHEISARIEKWTWTSKSIVFSMKKLHLRPVFSNVTSLSPGLGWNSSCSSNEIPPPPPTSQSLINRAEIRRVIRPCKDNPKSVRMRINIITTISILNKRDSQLEKLHAVPVTCR